MSKLHKYLVTTDADTGEVIRVEQLGSAGDLTEVPAEILGALKLAPAAADVQAEQAEQAPGVFVSGELAEDETAPGVFISSELPGDDAGAPGVFFSCELPEDDAGAPGVFFSSELVEDDGSSASL